MTDQWKFGPFKDSLGAEVGVTTGLTSSGVLGWRISPILPSYLSIFVDPILCMPENPVSKAIQAGLKDTPLSVAYSILLGRTQFYCSNNAAYRLGDKFETALGGDSSFKVNDTNKEAIQVCMKLLALATTLYLLFAGAAGNQIKADWDTNYEETKKDTELAWEIIGGVALLAGVVVALLKLVLWYKQRLVAERLHAASSVVVEDPEGIASSGDRTVATVGMGSSVSNASIE